jgi:hypothetical protein
MTSVGASDGGRGRIVRNPILSLLDLPNTSPTVDVVVAIWSLALDDGLATARAGISLVIVVLEEHLSEQAEATQPARL